MIEAKPDDPNPEKKSMLRRLLDEAAKKVDPNAETREHAVDPDLRRVAENADRIRFLKKPTMGPTELSTFPDPRDRIPCWACDQWGAYEHDWLNCPDCLRVYEKWLESEHAVLDGGTARDVVRRNAERALETCYDLLCCLWPEERALTEVIDKVDEARKAWAENPLARREK